ncbi:MULTISPECIES: FHA domain-containing protein [unclassified Pseudoalteromonas]|uniref:FHA domain-containing protein n=1 Tax=unclassified Pseudoalteromonas TaxID=194690 RepID=UPI002096A88F|nr:FHA domain-containing protein [Pseudoalteromonas sp. XMcav2-N]MCO7190869.1 FHA domain-containing protein [Pseudoalteromonas sp. XMcav2-N]
MKERLQSHAQEMGISSSRDTHCSKIRRQDTQIGTGMAHLLLAQTNDHIVLKAHHRFGRAESGVDTQVLGIEISRHHAVITWTGEHWTLRDTSKNGVFVNQVKILPDADIKLNLGDVITFSDLHPYSFIMSSLASPD